MNSTSALGLDIDPELEAVVEHGLDAVEARLRDEVKSSDAFVSEAAAHLVSAGGKRFRPLVTLLAAQFGDPAAPGVVPAAVVVELTHLATLYHDDVMDEALLRRGADSANTRWGNTIAILTGDFLFAQGVRHPRRPRPGGGAAAGAHLRAAGPRPDPRDRRPGGDRRSGGALPAGGGRQDRIADRHVGTVRRAAVGGAGDRDRVAHPMGRADRHRVPALRRPARRGLGVSRVGEDTGHGPAGRDPDAAGPAAAPRQSTGGRSACSRRWPPTCPRTRRSPPCWRSCGPIRSWPRPAP